MYSQYLDNFKVNLLLVLTSGSCSRHCRDFLIVAIKGDTFVMLTFIFLNVRNTSIFSYFLINYIKINKCRETNKYNIWTLKNYSNNSYCATSEIV